MQPRYLLLRDLFCLLEQAVFHPQAPYHNTVLQLVEAFLPQQIGLDTDPSGQSEHRNRFSESLAKCIRFGTWMDTPLDLQDRGTLLAIYTAILLASGQEVPSTEAERLAAVENAQRLLNARFL